MDLNRMSPSTVLRASRTLSFGSLFRRLSSRQRFFFQITFRTWQRTLSVASIVVPVSDPTTEPVGSDDGKDDPKDNAPSEFSRDVFCVLVKCLTFTCSVNEFSDLKKRLRFCVAPCAASNATLQHGLPGQAWILCSPCPIS